LLQAPADVKAEIMDSVDADEDAEYKASFLEELYSPSD
jgi:hypothetical protein